MVAGREPGPAAVSFPQMFEGEAGLMRTFRVKIWGATSYEDIEADDPRSAVEKLTGRKVRDVGRRGEIVATVRQKAGNSEMPVPYYAAETLPTEE